MHSELRPGRRDDFDEGCRVVYWLWEAVSFLALLERRVMGRKGTKRKCFYLVMKYYLLTIYQVIIYY